MVYYGDCTHCNKWGEAPKTFNQGKYFLKCPICGLPMYLCVGNPKEYGLREENKVVVTEFIKHNG